MGHAGDESIACINKKRTAKAPPGYPAGPENGGGFAVRFADAVSVVGDWEGGQPIPR